MRILALSLLALAVLPAAVSGQGGQDLSKLYTQSPAKYRQAIAGASVKMPAPQKLKIRNPGFHNKVSRVSRPTPVANSRPGLPFSSAINTHVTGAMTRQMRESARTGKSPSAGSAASEQAAPGSPARPVSPPLKQPVWEDAGATAGFWDQMSRTPPTEPVWADSNAGPGTSSLPGATGGLPSAPVWSDAASDAGGASSASGTLPGGLSMPRWADDAGSAADSPGDIAAPRWADADTVETAGLRTPKELDGAPPAGAPDAPVWSDEQKAPTAGTGGGNPAASEELDNYILGNLSDDAMRKMYEEALLSEAALQKQIFGALTTEAALRTGTAEEAANLLEGYESPVRTDPSNLSIELQNRDDTSAEIEGPDLEGTGRGGGTGLAYHMLDPNRGEVHTEGTGLAVAEAIKDTNRSRGTSNRSEHDEAIAQAAREYAAARNKVRMSDVVTGLMTEISANNDKHQLLSEDQMLALRDSLQRAVDRGASEKELRKIAKSYLSIGMNEAMASGAQMEEAEAWSQMGLDLADAAIGLNSVVNPVSGSLLEMGSGVSRSTVEGGAKAGVWQLAKSILPVNAAEALYNGGGFTDIMLALFQDAGNAVQLASATGGLKGAPANLAGDTNLPPRQTRADIAADSWVRRCVANPEECMAKNRQQVERSKSYLAGRLQGKAKVEAFQDIVAAGDEAAIKKALVGVQTDKHALQMINQADDATKVAFNRQLEKIYDQTDGAVVKKLTPDYAAKYGPDFVGLEVVKPTNPSNRVKVSFDRDVTVRVKYVRNGVVITEDIPASKLKPEYNAAFYEACGGEAVTGISPAGIDDFALEMDQVATDRLHPEAYGSSYEDLDVALNNPGGRFSDSEQVGMAMSYKANHWFEKADHYGAANPVQREMAVEEGMRQITKQFDNQLIKRTEAVNRQLATTGRPAVSIPNDLQQAVDVMKRVGTGPGQGLTPAQAEQILESTGWTAREVGYEMGKWVESLQKLSPMSE